MPHRRRAAQGPVLRLAAILALLVASAPAGASEASEAPAAPVLESPRSGALLGPAQAPGGQVTVLGGAAPGAQVIVWLDGVAQPALAVDGLFGLVVMAGEGPHDLEVVAVDAAGLRSPPLLVRFVLDMTPPPAPRLAWPGPEDRPAPGAFLLQGSAEPGAEVAVSCSGVRTVVTAAPDGGWQLPVTAAAGTWTLTLTATDGAGNASEAAQAAVVVAPAAAPGEGAGPDAIGCSHAGGGAPALLLLLVGLAAWRPARRSALQGGGPGR